MARKKVTIDGNEAAAYVAHKTNEVCAIYPITPSSNMGEWADEWSAMGRTNIWGTIPSVVEMQSEAGASATTHGALQAGALTTTFTAAQGLLLMIPTMFKVAGELTSTVWHVSARTVATHALSIFGDHGDVMAVRSTGFGLICTGSVQEVMDMALIAQAATLQARVPFIHFFDGFRTSHEVQKIEQLTDEDIKAMVTDDLVNSHRARGMTPDRPVLRGTSQNPDVFFQAREACNKFYDATPAIVQAEMDKFAKIVGRSYHLFDYVGPADAERVIVVMGTGAEIVHETVDVLAKKGEKVGVVKVRLFRPFSMDHLIAALPKSVKAISVLDRTKEPGCAGEPMYQDVITALAEAQSAGKLPFAMPKVVGGRYGLSSKEFTPAMVKAVFDDLKKPAPKNHFTVGINDDVTHTSLAVDYSFSTETDSVKRCLFYGLGSDGTVGANKNSIKIIGEEPRFYAQGYFVYDSKKAGAVTVSHLRFGPDVIRSSYLITRSAVPGLPPVVVPQRTTCSSTASRRRVPAQQRVRARRGLGQAAAGSAEADHREEAALLRHRRLQGGQGNRHGGAGQHHHADLLLQHLGVLPAEEAIAKIKKTIQKTYERKGPEVVQKNFKAVDLTAANLKQVNYPQKVSSSLKMPPHCGQGGARVRAQCDRRDRCRPWR